MKKSPPIDHNARSEELGAKLEAALASMTDAVFISDAAGRFVNFNEAFATFCRFANKAESLRTFDEYPGIIEMFMPDGQSAPLNMWPVQRALRGETGRDLEYRLRRKDTGETWIGSHSIAPIRDKEGVITGSVVVARDITERKLEEEKIVRLNTELKVANLALKESEELFHTYVEQAADPIVLHDFTGRILEVNRQACLTLGYTREELLSLRVFDIETDYDLTKAQAVWSKMEPGSTYTGQSHNRRKDGSLIPVEVRLGCIERNGIRLFLVLIRDISERKQQEASYERLAKAVEHAAETIMITDPQGVILYVNPAFEKITGYTSKEAIGQNPRVLKSGKHDDGFYRKMWETLKRGETWSGHLVNRHKDGSFYDEEASISPVRDGNGTVVNYVAVKRDVTQELKAEAQVRQMQRTESIGTLASGIAHDLNNALAPILLALEILADRATDNTDRELLETMRQSAQHGADLVKQVLSYSRGVKGERVALSLITLWKAMGNIIRDTFPKNIILNMVSAPDLWKVDGDATQLNQVFTNLCVNARDAMPEGGMMEISMQNIVLDDVYAGMNPASKEGAYVIVQVKDTGVGIPKEIQERIFDPFFTTKEAGKGTGMGLATVMSIVKSHGGFVTHSSEEGKGSTFKVYLPASTSRQKSQETAVGQTELPRAHGETILLVDDEERVREVAKMVLARAGYRVMTAANGAEALALYAQHREKIALVLTDMAMPVMDGNATISALRAMNPGVKIIASSGLIDDHSMTSAGKPGAVHFIPKPYTAETMLKVLAEALKEKT